jgi:hypothetical protein
MLKSSSLCSYSSNFGTFEEISILSNGGHLGNDSWVVLFQNCVRHFRTPTKMATTAEFNLT